MVECHRQLRSSTANNYIPEKPILEDLTLEPSLTDVQEARFQLRQRWELAYVLNFIRVFGPVIPRDLKIPAEEIETALITANENLGRIHIALLQGIPPVNKSMTDPDAWITSVCKKLAKWWSLISEGEKPLRADHGREILSYKQLDPTTRLLIFKALCDVRAEQDDILCFIEYKLKKGTTVGYFRKERMDVGDSGVTYWYEGDGVIGHRLYREIGKTYSKPKAKGKGCGEPTFESQWETIATNIEEFPQIMDSLSSSSIPGEAFVGELIKAEILPVLKRIEMKKARLQRLALQLEGFLNPRIGPCRNGPQRSCRDRRVAVYTFDEYDRSIDEAIRISTEPDIVKPSNANGEEHKNGLGKHCPSSNGRNMDTLNELSGNDKDTENSEVNDDVNDNRSDHDDDDDDDDYDKCEVGAGVNDDDDDDDDTVNSSFKKKNTTAPAKSVHEKRHLNFKLDARLRRSSRIFDASHAVTKKRLRQRPTENVGFIEVISSDSEDESPAKSIKATGDESQEESGEDLS